MTTAAITVAPVRKRIRVNADPARAFDVFTRTMKAWWPARHSINRSPIADIVLEPRVGGRWLERGDDGAESQWGRVLAWEPPSRLVLAWQINTEWRFDPDLITEVEIRFSAEAGGTLVELEHRLDGYGPAAAQMREIFDGPTAWDETLVAYAGAVSAG